MTKTDLSAASVCFYLLPYKAGPVGGLGIQMEEQMMTTHETITINGLDVTAAQQTIEALKDDASLAQFKFRARNNWVGGAENRSTIRGFYGAGQEDTSRTEDFEFVNGEPPVLLGKNEGANPVEFLLHGLAGCVTTTLILHATVRGISIRELSTELEGDIDLYGLLGLGPDVTPGYREIRIRMHIQADCTDEELEDLMACAQAHSPVCDTVCRPVPVFIERV